MRRIFFLFISLLFLVSCSQDDLEDGKSKVLSGVIEESDVPQTIDLGDRKIIVSFSQDSLSTDTTQLRTGFVGPYYASGDMTLALKNQKIVVRSGDLGIPTGTYICEVYSFRQKIKLPSNAVTAKVEFPSPAGYSNYTTQTKGVNWSMSTEATGTYVSFTFYTLRIMYDMAGRLLGYVIPMDGRQIRIPYYYFTY